jgi:hypothetical protein
MYSILLPNGVFERNTIFWHQNFNDLYINVAEGKNIAIPPEVDYSRKVIT